MPVFNVTNSALSTLTQAQQDNLTLMSNTDIRSVLSSLTDLSSVQASQTASVALNTAGVAELKSIAVIEKSQVLAKTSFTFAANVWTINVFHELNNKFPITAIFDATGDVQFIQFVGKDPMNGTVELTQAQYDSNAFPLNIVLHSKVSSVVTSSGPGQWRLNTITNKYYRRLNGVIESSLNGITPELSNLVYSMTAAYMVPVAGVIVFPSLPDYYSVELSALNGTWTYLTLSQYQNHIADPSTISL